MLYPRNTRIINCIVLSSRVINQAFNSLCAFTFPLVVYERLDRECSLLHSNIEPTWSSDFRAHLSDCLVLYHYSADTARQLLQEIQFAQTNEVNYLSYIIMSHLCPNSVPQYCRAPQTLDGFKLPTKHFPHTSYEQNREEQNGSLNHRRQHCLLTAFVIQMDSSLHSVIFCHLRQFIIMIMLFNTLDLNDPSSPAQENMRVGNEFQGLMHWYGFIDIG